MGQFNADQSRNMQAQAANVGQQQFGANQGLSNAQNTAQYGQAAQAANVGQQQFGANYGLGALAGQRLVRLTMQDGKVVRNDAVKH
jgi:hypothetical protein